MWPGSQKCPDALKPAEDVAMRVLWYAPRQLSRAEWQASQPPPVLQSISIRVASHHYALHKRDSADRYFGQVVGKPVQSLVVLAGIYAGTQPLGVRTLSIGGRTKEYGVAAKPHFCYSPSFPQVKSAVSQGPVVCLTDGPPGPRINVI